MCKIVKCITVWQVWFVVDKVASGQVFSEYFGFPCQNRSFHELLHLHTHPWQGAEALRRADHPSKESCPRTSHRNETASFMEAVKAQDWAVEPKGEKNNISRETAQKTPFLCFLLEIFCLAAGVVYSHYSATGLHAITLYCVWKWYFWNIILNKMSILVWNVILDLHQFVRMGTRI
jgi:hypothetical protein